MVDLESFCRKLPKAELHLHLEGTLEPDLMFELADRNSVTLPYRSIDEVRAAYQFQDLQSFLDLYYAGMAVLKTEADFELLTRRYLEQARNAGVVHAEVFFDPQAHESRGVPFEVSHGGIRKALDASKRDFGISTRLILCFLRHLSGQEAIETYKRAQPWRSSLLGVGLDSSEREHPPEDFIAAFAQARADGLHTVAHAGEEGPPAYIWGALNALGAERIDHGVRCEEDPALVEYLRRTRVPLTVCPLSNVRLRVFPTLAQHNVKRLLDLGLCVSLHSDDPAYFGGDIAENYLATAKALALSVSDLHQLARNSFESAFEEEATREAWIESLDAFAGNA